MDLTKIIEDAKKNYGTAIGAAVEPYLPAVRRLPMEELTRWITAVINNSGMDAYKLIQGQLNPDELALEKERLAGLVELAANAQASKFQLVDQIRNAIMLATLKTLLASVGL